MARPSSACREADAPPAPANPAEAANHPVDGLDQLGLVLGLGVA